MVLLLDEKQYCCSLMRNNLTPNLYCDLTFDYKDFHPVCSEETHWQSKVSTKTCNYAQHSTQNKQQAGRDKPNPPILHITPNFHQTSDDLGSICHPSGFRFQVDKTIHSCCGWFNGSKSITIQMRNTISGTIYIHI